MERKNLKKQLQKPKVPEKKEEEPEPVPGPSILVEEEGPGEYKDNSIL